MKRWLHTSMVFAIGLGWTTAPAGAQQTIERERSVTGPGGRTIKRDVTIQRGPGYVDRKVEVQRPGGTYEREAKIQRGPGFVDRSVNIQRPGGAGLSRETVIQRGPGFAPPPPGRGFYPGYRGFGPRTIVEQPVIVGGGGGGIGLVPALVGGAGLFGLGMLTGSAINSAPPPQVVPSPPPVVVYNPPQPYQPGTAPAGAAAPLAPTVVVDPVADSLTKLQSFFESNRKEGAIELGRLRDPRAVPSLVDRLKNDSSRHVRAAAATALGEIGDPRANAFLERATIYDRRQEVRDAAGQALVHMPRSAAPTDPAAAQASGTIVSSPAAAANVPALQPAEAVPPPPEPESGRRN